MGQAIATATGRSRPNRLHYANLTELLHVLAAFLIGIAVAVAQYFLSPHAYFWDDLQAVHIPAMRHIGDALVEGRFPILTLGVWQGGNLFGEHYHGLTNPFHLALYVAATGFDNLRIASAVVVGAHIMLLAGGSFVLARSYGASRPIAHVAATAIATNNFIAYWFAFTWFPAMASTAWLLWAWAFLLRSHRSPAQWVACAVLCWLTFVSGWPYASVILVLIAAVVAVQVRIETGGRTWLAPPTALIAAIILAMPAFIATLDAASVGSRGLFFGNRDVLVPNLADVLQVSMPFHLGHMVMFGGHQLLSVPIFFAAWFMLPLLPYLRWPPVPRPAAILSLSTLALLFLAGTQTPEVVTPLRWPFKFLPFLHMAIVLLFLLLLDRYGLKPHDKKRWRQSLLLCISAAIFSVFSNPAALGLTFAAAFALFCCAMLVVSVMPRRRLAALGVMAVVAVGCFGANRLAFPVETAVGHLGLPEVTDRVRIRLGVPDAYTLTVGEMHDVPRADRYGSFPTGLAALEAGHASINGYSPIGHRGLARTLCIYVPGDTCAQAGASALSIDPATGVPLVDLMRVDRLVIRHGDAADAVAGDLDPSWTLAEENDHALVYTRALPNAGLPGTLSWSSPGVEVAPSASAEVLTESVEILARSGDRDRLIFARLWWPGYEATLDGAPLAVEPYRDVFVSVSLPPGQATGVVRLSYGLPYALESGVAVAVGIVVIVVGVWRHRRLFSLSIASDRPS